MPKKYGKGAMPYGDKGSSSGQGKGGSKLGPRHSKAPSQVKTPKQTKTNTTTRSDYVDHKQPGSKSAGSTRTAYGDKGAGKTVTTGGSGGNKVKKIPGSKSAGKKGMKY